MGLWYFKENKFKVLEEGRIVELSDFNKLHDKLFTPAEPVAGNIFFNETSPILITQSFTSSYAKIWDLKKGKLIDTFRNELLRVSNVFKTNIELSMKGHISFVKDGDNRLKEIFNTSKPNKRIKVTDVLSINNQETKLFMKLNDSSYSVISTISGNVLQNINTGNFIINTGYYSSTINSFIGIASRRNNTKELYLWIVKGNKILSLNKPGKNMQVIKPL